MTMQTRSNSSGPSEACIEARKDIAESDKPIPGSHVAGACVAGAAVGALGGTPASIGIGCVVGVLANTAVNAVIKFGPPRAELRERLVEECNVRRNLPRTQEGEGQGSADPIAKNKTRVLDI